MPTCPLLLLRLAGLCSEGSSLLFLSSLPLLPAVRHTLTELISRYPGGVLPELHPVEDMGIEDEAVIKAIEAEKEAKATLKSMADSGSEQLTAAEREAQLRRKAQLLMEADDVEKKMQENQLTK